MSAKHKIVAIMGHGFPLTMHKAKDYQDSLKSVSTFQVP